MKRGAVSAVLSKWANAAISGNTSFQRRVLERAEQKARQEKGDQFLAYIDQNQGVDVEKELTRFLEAEKIAAFERFERHKAERKEIEQRVYSYALPRTQPRGSFEPSDEQVRAIAQEIALSTRPEKEANWLLKSEDPKARAAREFLYNKVRQRVKALNLRFPMGVMPGESEGDRQFAGGRVSRALLEQDPDLGDDDETLKNCKCTTQCTPDGTPANRSSWCFVGPACTDISVDTGVRGEYRFCDPDVEAKGASSVARASYSSSKRTTRSRSKKSVAKTKSRSKKSVAKLRQGGELAALGARTQLVQRLSYHSRRRRRSQSMVAF